LVWNTRSNSSAVSSEAAEVFDPGAAHENVEPAESPGGRLNGPVDLVGHGHIALHGDGVAASGVDLCSEPFGRVGLGPVVDGHRCPVDCETSHDLRADSA
jgi:hypothetical protein